MATQMQLEVILAGNRIIVMSTNLEYRARERQRVVVVQNDGKEMYKKSVLHVQSCFFAN